MKKTCIVFICFASAILFPSILLCYESDHTHPAITSKAITQYNFSISGITNMVKGSIDEDYPGLEQWTGSFPYPRYFNHFFDQNGNGWIPIKPLPLNFPNAKEFAIQSSKQNAWINWVKYTSPIMFDAWSSYIKDFSWEKAIESYNANDRNNAYLALGHISHLLVDMGSPAHVWNDTHVFDIWTSGTYMDFAGDPYEFYVNKIGAPFYFYRNVFSLCATPECLFDEFAKYTRKNYFSKNSIWINNDWREDHECNDERVGNTTYLKCKELDEGNHKTGKTYRAATRSSLFNFGSYYTLDDRVFLDYWVLLSGKTVSYVGGLINLFEKEVADPPKYVVVTAPNGSTFASPWKLGVGAMNATEIYYTMVNTYNGDTPAEPREPTSTDNDGSIPIDTIQENGFIWGHFDYYASVGQYKRSKLRFRAYNGVYAGMATGSISYIMNMRDLPDAISANPSSGVWTSTPHNIQAGSNLATTIYYTMVNTYNGDTPADPREPTSSNNDGSINVGLVRADNGNGYFTGYGSGLFTLYAYPGQYKRSKLRFRAYNSVGAGPASGVYSYSIDLTSINPTIAQGPMSGHPGTTFTQWGTGFTHNGTATLHFQKPDGTEYPTQKINLDGIGHFETTYYAPLDKPIGTYTWWAIDDATGIRSNNVSYVIN